MLEALEAGTDGVVLHTQEPAQASLSCHVSVHKQSPFLPILATGPLWPLSDLAIPACWLLSCDKGYFFLSRN